MRAPSNTNQFLMQEKYTLLHLRSDSVGSDSSGGGASDSGGGASDSDPDLTDMDSYLGALENARGALPDDPPPSDPGARPEGRVRPAGPHEVLEQEQGVRPQEDSLPYFPSEDDLLQTTCFMQRDFVEFCHFLAT